ncbi:MAG TPA: hydroxylase, partial [Alphaproteobacteria bacterium]|nr:hydroxylase [Alphaproteobacteria bacterium]
SELEDIWSTVTANQSLTIEQRMRIRLASTHAIHESKTVANAVYEAAGASAIFAGSPFQRRFRDIHTVAQQIQGRKSHFQTVGSFLLGHPPDLAMV